MTRNDSTNPCSTVVKRWIESIANKLGIVIVYTRRIHTLLANRANYLKRQQRVLTGGSPSRKFFQKTWDIKLDKAEVKTKGEQVLETKLSEANSTIKKLEKDKKQLRQKVCVMSDKLKMTTPSRKRGRDRAKAFEDLSDRQQRRIKRQRTSNCIDSLAWLHLEGYTPRKLELVNNSTGTLETLTLQQLEAQEIFGANAHSMTGDEFDTINMMLFVKDRYDISNNAYHEMARICRNMPRHYLLKQRIAELNKQWNIKPTPNGISGVQQSLQDRLRVKIARLHQISKPDETFRMTRKVNVKLSGDGTNIGKRLHVVNFTFTLLEEGAHAYSYEGNHTLAIFKEAEKYEQLRMALEDVRKEVEQLDTIIVDGISYKVNFYLGGDWKFLALVTGINSASCRHSCIWCKCPSQERHLTDKQWSLIDVELGARTIEENIELSRLPKSRKKFNVSHAPLFPTIPLRNVVIDNLHLFLRVADVLVDLLIVELRRQDSATKLSTTVFDGHRYKHLHSFQTFISSLGIPGYNFWIGQNSQQLKWRTLTGPEGVYPY